MVNNERMDVPHLRPQDLAVLVKLLAWRKDSWRQVDLADELGLSQSEIAKSLQRLNKARLVDRKIPIQKSAIEFLVHGCKYAFPVQIGPLAMGVPTAISAPAHAHLVVDAANEGFVWPSVKGGKRGQSIVPLYPGLGIAALRDDRFYAMMAAVEIIRVGRVRERRLAEAFLSHEVKS